MKMCCFYIGKKKAHECYVLSILSKMSNKMSYPCVICDEECLVYTIQCFQCEHWVHGECIPMTADLLQKWSDANMKFLCKDCCFADGHFDHK